MTTSIILLFLLFGCLQTTTKDNLFEIIDEKGVKYASVYVTNYTKRYQYSYELAWLKFREGKLQDSKDLLEYLEKKDPKPILRGNCHYLRGHIALYELKHKKAIIEFEKAIEIYEEYSMYANIFHSYLGIAMASMDIGQLSKASKAMLYGLTYFKISVNHGELRIDNPDFTPTHKANLAQYYTIRKRYNLIIGDLPQAIINSKNSLGYYRAVGSVEGESNSLSDLGFIYMLTGNYEFGWKYTIQAQGIIAKLNDRKKFIYNQLNILIYFKCKGMPSEDLIDQIEEWILEYHDNKLNDYLIQVLNVQCKGDNDGSIEESMH